MNIKECIEPSFNSDNGNDETIDDSFMVLKIHN